MIVLNGEYRTVASIASLPPDAPLAWNLLTESVMQHCVPLRRGTLHPDVPGGTPLDWVLGLTMKQNTNQVLYAYWNGVRGDRLAPRRFEIEPARIAPILPETFILERLDTDTFVYRLAGTKLCEQFGAEFRGTNFLDGWSDDDRKSVLQHITADCAGGGVLVMTVQATGVDRTGPEAHFEIAVMPLIHAATSVSRYLGAMSAIDPPEWLGSTRLVSRRLIERHVIWPEGRPSAARPLYKDPPPVFANMAGARLVKSERRTFRVFDGGRASEDPV